MEKRDKGRVLKRLFVRFGKDLPEHIGFTGDISPTGIFIKTNKVFEPGTLLTIELTLPDNRILSVNGHVVWARRIPPNLIRFIKKSGMGIHLAQIPDDYQHFIRGLH
jgi:Tfp pilus assembly protein PilZ